MRYAVLTLVVMILSYGVFASVRAFAPEVAEAIAGVIKRHWIPLFFIVGMVLLAIIITANGLYVPII